MSRDPERTVRLVTDPDGPYTDLERRTLQAGPRVVKILKFSKSGNHRAQVKKLTVLGNQRITSGGIVKRAKERLASKKKVGD